MISNQYIIDSSSLIELNKHNPIDVFPTVWQRLESLISMGLLIAPKEVLYEIRNGDDQLAEWAKAIDSGFYKKLPNDALKADEIVSKKYNNRR